VAVDLRYLSAFQKYNPSTPILHQPLMQMMAQQMIRRGAGDQIGLEARRPTTRQQQGRIDSPGNRWRACGKQFGSEARKQPFQMTLALYRQHMHRENLLQCRRKSGAGWGVILADNRHALKMIDQHPRHQQPGDFCAQYHDMLVTTAVDEMIPDHDASPEAMVIFCLE
jgi:hypothetical protein